MYSPIVNVAPKVIGFFSSLLLFINNLIRSELECIDIANE